MGVIHRYEIPVDGEWHRVPGSSPTLHVACRDPYVVEFWAFSNPDAPGREYCVVGTGQPFPDRNVMYGGTAIAPGGSLVWHLISRW